MARIEWRPRLKIFSSRDRKVYYDPDTKRCVSYSTTIGLVYDKVLILSAYNYSRTTNGHCYDLCEFFKNRGYIVRRVPCQVFTHGGLQAYINSTNHYIADAETAKKRKRSSYVIDRINKDISECRTSIHTMEDLLLTGLIEDELRDDAV
jgi:hypothetical protein